MTQKLKVGIIGCGNIAWEKHLPNLKAHEAVDLVAFHDHNGDLAQKSLAAFGSDHAKVYGSAEDLLASGIDVVHICTPNSTHAPLSIAALNQGLHVLCEKPMAMNLDEAKAVQKAVHGSGKKYSLGCQNRFRRDSLYLKALGDADYFGHIYHAKAHAIRRRAVPVWGKFLSKEAQGGGPLIDIGVHALDLTFWLMDNFDPLYVSGMTYQELGKQEGLFNSFGPWDPAAFEVEDSAFAFIVMKNGATVLLESSWALNSLHLGEAKTTLCGTKAGADMDDGLRINGDQNGTLFTLHPNLDSSSLEYYDDSKNDPMPVEIKSWIDSILTDQDPCVTVDQSLAVMKVIDAIYKSAERKAPVFIDEV